MRFECYLHHKSLCIHHSSSFIQPKGIKNASKLKFSSWHPFWLPSHTHIWHFIFLLLLSLRQLCGTALLLRRLCWCWPGSGRGQTDWAWAAPCGPQPEESCGDRDTRDTSSCTLIQRSVAPHGGGGVYNAIQGLIANFHASILLETLVSYMVQVMGGKGVNL